MSLEQQLHTRISDTTGVAAVYTANPGWLGLVQRLGSTLNREDPAARYVLCSSEDDAAGRHLLVRARIGSDGSVPAPAVARSVAATIRAAVAEQQPGVRVVVELELASLGV